MKNLKNLGLAFLATALMIGTASAQSQFHKLPRMKVDAKKAEYTKAPKKESKKTVTEVAFVEPTKTVETTPIVESTPVVENTSTTTTSNVVTTKAKTKVVAKKEVSKPTKKVTSSDFTKQVKSKSKLMDVKDTKKSAMEKWLLIMIILLAAGLLLIILGVVLTFAIFSPIGWIFYIIGALCWTGAGIVLILGLTGVI